MKYASFITAERIKPLRPWAGRKCEKLAKITVVANCGELQCTTYTFRNFNLIFIKAKFQTKQAPAQFWPRHQISRADLVQLIHFTHKTGPERSGVSQSLHPTRNRAVPRFKRSTSQTPTSLYDQLKPQASLLPGRQGGGRPNNIWN